MFRRATYRAQTFSIYKEKLTEKLIYPDEITHLTLGFGAFGVSPDVYSALLERQGRDINWLLGLWELCDKIPGLYKERMKIMTDYEIDAKRTLETLESWKETQNN
jgi:hypothetical protein